MQIPGHDLKAGWGVFRLSPWHLAGVFSMSADAERLARVMGVGYVVKYGDHSVGTQNFSFENDPNA
jgi:hypothetical protein